MPELATALQDEIKDLPDEVKELLPQGLRRRVPPSWLNDGLVAYYPFNGNAKDESGNGNHGTVEGPVFSSSRHGDKNASLSLQNRSDRVSIPATTAIKSLNTSDATFMMWINSAVDQNASYILSRNKGGSSQWGCLFLRQGSSKTTFDFHTSRPGLPNRREETTVPIADGEWQHVAVITSETATTVMVNGVVKRKATPPLTMVDTQDAPLRFGATVRDEGGFVGTLDDVRIYNRALSPTEVKTLYDFESQPPEPTTDQALPPNTAPTWLNDGLVAYYPFNGNAKDESGNGNDGVTGSVIASSNRFGQEGKSITFLGQPDSYVSSPAPLPRMNILSIAAWVLMPSEASEKNKWPFLSLPRKTNDGFPGSGLHLCQPTFTAILFIPGRITSASANSTTRINSRGWTHVALSVSDSSGRIFVNGQMQDEKITFDPSFLIEPQGRLHFGREFDRKDQGGTVRPTVCSIDDVRIYDRALSPDEVKALYEYESQPPGSPAGQAPSPAVAPFDATQAQAHQQAWANHLGVPVETTNSIGMKFVVIPAGEFMMGSPEDEPRRKDNEALHKVTLTQPFQMGMHEVTQEQYQTVMGTNPSKFKGPQNPVEQVSWNDAVEFCRKLSEQPKEKSAGYVYRLPTEAEWEYACRAGTTTKYSFGDSESALGDYAWYIKNAGSRTHPVGQKKPNAWGLYDMRGNVFEWCQDWLSGYPGGKLTDPTGPSSGSDRRVARGGSWNSDDWFCRSADRDSSTPDERNGSNLSFRVLRVVTPQAPPPAVAPFGATQAKAHQQAWADHLGVPVETTNSIGMKFAVIPAGEFMMGSPENEPGRQDDETLHKVTLTQSFQLGVHEVTQEQYQKVMGTNPSDFKGPQNPVEQVSWNDAVEFCRKLSAMPAEKSAGYVYRLPTQADWGYACRAGTTTTYSFGDSDSQLGAYAWYGNNSGDQQIDALNIWNTDKDNYSRRLLGNNCGTHSVGQKKSNPWGLYDMHGNVYEWCQDWYGDHPIGSVIDPTGPASGKYRVLRGGAFNANAQNVRSANLTINQPDSRSFNSGFRVARTYR
jgi:formylglycine-generating enzyme required for sulfatase activity